MPRHPIPAHLIFTGRFSAIGSFFVGGRLVRELVNESYAGAGEHTIRLDGRGQNGASLASGVYLYRIESRDGVTTGRFAILR